MGGNTPNRELEGQFLSFNTSSQSPQPVMIPGIGSLPELPFNRFNSNSPRQDTIVTPHSILPQNQLQQYEEGLSLPQIEVHMKFN